MKRFRPGRPALLAIAVSTLLLGAPASSYDIMAPRIHEAFTLAAEECWKSAKARGAEPSDCSAYRPRVAQLSGLQWSLLAAQREVRWPDDPRREIKSLGFTRPLFNGKLGLCEGKMARRGRELHRVGLFCASHYGDLQFLHAMASTNADSDSGAAARRTRQKMLEWAAFTYEVATGRIAPEESYCDQFVGRASIRDAMVPTGFPYCGSGSKAWTVAEFFSFRCSRVLLWESCPVVSGTPDFVPTVAKGALLHMIQDSFSQSHSVRSIEAETDGAGNPLPRVECNAPSRFFTYSLETKAGHSIADKLPHWQPSCANTSRHDILAASAMTFHHIDAKTPTPRFVAYLSERVF